VTESLEERTVEHDDEDGGGQVRICDCRKGMVQSAMGDDKARQRARPKGVACREEENEGITEIRWWMQASTLRGGRMVASNAPYQPVVEVH
jgi:hypothetical protein